MSYFASWRLQRETARVPARTRRGGGRLTGLTFVAFLCLLLAACFPDKDFIQRFVPEADDALARKFIEAVRTGEFTAARQMLDPRLDNKNTAKLLEEIRSRFLNHGEPLSIDVAGVNSRVSFSGTEGQTSLVYQIHFPDAWVLAEIQIERKSGVSRILKGNFTPLPGSLEATHAFSFQGKSFGHYLLLVACVGIPLFILITVVVCARSRVRRKWLWMIFILFGVGQFTMNWTTGTFDFSPLFIQLGGGGCSRAGYFAPWVLSFSIPLGAIIFLVRRRQLIAAAAGSGGAQPPPLPSLAGPPGPAAETREPGTGS